ncbi:helix-turn-helix domain-containing protein, partial [Peptococcaceae bacterium]|nr:helix-turn-helix domain-containing protein [Peptococcaceae bacterium]
GCNYYTRVEQRKMTTIRRRKTGFFIADNAIFDRKDLSANEKLVYLYFCRRANNENKAWPSFQRVADDSGLSRRTVIDVIKKLINKSLLEKNTRPRQSNVYTLFPVPNYNTGSGLNAGSEIDALGSEINTPGKYNYYTRVVQEMHPKNTQNKNTQEKKERVSVCHDRYDTFNFSQSKINSRKSKKINKLSLEEEIQKLGATPEQVEQARQCVEERKKAGVKIWNIERYFLGTLKNLVKFEKITKQKEKQKNTSEFSLKKEIQRLKATKEQVERAWQRMEEYKKATGAIIWNIERYFLAVLKNLIKFDKITDRTAYEKERERRRKIFEALLMS